MEQFQAPEALKNLKDRVVVITGMSGIDPVI